MQIKYKKNSDPFYRVIKQIYKLITSAKETKLFSTKCNQNLLCYIDAEEMIIKNIIRNHFLSIYPFYKKYNSYL